MADLYIILIYICLFTSVVLSGLLIGLYILLEPFKNFFIARFKGQDIMLTIRNDGFISMHNVKYRDQLYSPHDVNPPWSYLRRDATLYRFGGIKVAPVIDNWGITSNQGLLNDVATLKDHGIISYGEMREQVDREYIIDQISEINGETPSGDKYILKHKPFMERAFSLVPVIDVLNYVGTVAPLEINNIVDNRAAKYLERYKLNPIESNNTTIIIISVVVLGGIAVMGILGAKLLGLI